MVKKYQHPPEKELRELYVEKNLSMDTIAKKYKIPQYTVGYCLIKYGMKKKGERTPKKGYSDEAKKEYPNRFEGLAKSTTGYGVYAIK